MRVNFSVISTQMNENFVDSMNRNIKKTKTWRWVGWRLASVTVRIKLGGCGQFWWRLGVFGGSDGGSWGLGCEPWPPWTWGRV